MPRSLSRVRVEPREDDLVEEPTVLGDRPAVNGLADEPVLLQHPHGGRVIGEDAGLEADETHLAEGDWDECPEGIGRDPPPPAGLGEPVPDLARLVVDVLERMDPDPPTASPSTSIASRRCRPGVVANEMNRTASSWV